MLTNEKSRAATLVMATRLSINKDPWLSVPVFQQVRLYLSYTCSPLFKLYNFFVEIMYCVPRILGASARDVKHTYYSSLGGIPSFHSFGCRKQLNRASVLSKELGGLI